MKIIDLNMSFPSQIALFAGGFVLCFAIMFPFMMKWNNPGDKILICFIIILQNIEIYLLTFVLS